MKKSGENKKTITLPIQVRKKITKNKKKVAIL
jgi:hypothetical protein